MRISDYIRYSYILFQKDKKRSIICIIESFILSILTLGCFYLGFNYYNSMSDIENKYLHKNNLIIDIYGFNEEVVMLAKKYSASKIICESYFAIYLDFENERINLYDGKIPSTSYELLSNSIDNYIGEKIIENDIEYTICGKYSSDIYDGYIGNIFYLADDIFISSTSIIFADAKNGKINEINNFVSILDSMNIEYNHSNYDNFMTYHRNGIFIVVFFIVLAIILFFSTILFFLNSYNMALDQNKLLLVILRLGGLESKKLIMIESIYGFIIASIGNLLAYLFVFILSLFNKSDIFYSLLLPSYIKNVIIEYEINSYFPWYIIFINLFLFVIFIFLAGIKNNKRILEKEITIIKEWNI